MSTFVSGGRNHPLVSRAHLKKRGKWIAELGGKFTDRAQEGEGKIAQNVTDDAVSLNFIRAPASLKTS